MFTGHPRSAVALAVVLLLCGVLALAGACTTGDPTASPSATGELRVEFFDVGESGDGFLVTTPDGDRMLIDGGRRESDIVDRLKEAGVGRLDVVIATNPDADHIGGLVDAINTFPIGEVWVSGDVNTTVTYERFLDALEASNAPVRVARAGDVISLGSLPVQVLHPSEPLFPDRNNDSVVVRLEFGSVSFLFAGDIEKEAEERLVESGAALRSTVLKLAHHGSRTSTTPSFVEAVDPEIAVYQAGANNQYGHPHQETLLTLEEAGVKVYGTGVNGKVTVVTDGTRYRVETAR